MSPQYTHFSQCLNEKLPLPWWDGLGEWGLTHFFYSPNPTSPLKGEELKDFSFRHYSCFILTTAPLSAWNPLSIFTFGALNVTIAPLLIVTPLPIVIEALSIHSQAVPELNVTLVSTTGLPEQSGHNDPPDSPHTQRTYKK